MEIIILKMCDLLLDITPNYHNYPTKESMARVKRMNVSILRMKAHDRPLALPAFLPISYKLIKPSGSCQ